MGFTENTKKEIRKKAMFKCCFCENLDIEVHHIVPENEGGLDDMSNGAPLCPNCHKRYGNDSSKRKRIIEARDNWYETVERVYPDNREVSRLEDISIKLDELQDNQISLDEFKTELRKYADEAINEAINKMTLGTAASTASGIANASVSPSASPSLSPSPSLSESDLE